jgi:DNA repair protein RadC
MNQSTLNLGDYASEPGFTIAAGEQPQQRFETFGAGALSDTELIAIMLHTGIHGHSVLGLASQLIAQAGSIAGLASWQPQDFRRLKGIGLAKGRQLAALIEIGRRMIKQPAEQAPMLNRPELIAAHMAPYVRGLEVEKFWVLCLNRKNRLKKLVEVTSGTATAALAHPREVFRSAVQHGATAIACVHNHPSGDPAPSSADVQVTRQLREAAKALDIELLDHVVVGNAGADPTGLGFYSFRSAGIL